MKKKEIDLVLLKQFIEEFRKQNNRLPHMEDFRVSKGSPYGQGLLERHFGGIINICKVLDIDFKKGHKSKTKIDEFKLKKFIYLFKQKNSRLPGSKDFSVKKGAPYSFKIITDNYGTLANCYTKLGFQNNIRPHTCVIDDNIMRDYINKFNKEHGVNPGLNDFKRRLGCPYNKSSILEYYGGIDEMYRKFNLNSKPISKLDTISDAKLLTDLVDAIYTYKTTDRDILKRESNNIYDRSVYERRFGTWSNALKIAGFNDYNRVLLMMYPDEYKGQDPQEFLKVKIGKDGDFTEEQKYLINNKTSSDYQIKKHFKYKNLYIIACNEEITAINLIHMKQKSLDGHICDSNFEKYVDDFLYREGYMHNVHVKYPGITKVCDFEVYKDENIVFVEVAGFYGSSDKYNQNIKDKIAYCKDKELKLYVLYDLKQPSLNGLKKYLDENL